MSKEGRDESFPNSVVNLDTERKFDVDTSFPKSVIKKDTQGIWALFREKRDDFQTPFSTRFELDLAQNDGIFFAEKDTPLFGATTPEGGWKTPLRGPTKTSPLTRAPPRAYVYIIYIR